MKMKEFKKEEMQPQPESGQVRQNSAKPLRQKHRTKKIVLTVIFWVAFAVMLVSGSVLLYELVIIPAQNHKAVQEYKELYSRPESSSVVSAESVSEEDPQVLPEFVSLLEKNRDTAGWLTIPNTKLDNPVFWTPDNQNYYLRRDADGNNNKLGSLFLSAGSTLQPQAKVQVMYGHNMTVFDNMAFGLKLRKTPKAEIKRRVEEAAKILDITHLLDRKPKALSGGQRQRVALGRAIVREPKVFLLDEPLSNLDAKLRAQMRTELAKLHKKLGTTFIYVTHDQTEAMTMEGDSLFRCLKTGLFGFSAEEIAALENYTFVWGIDRAGWLEEWKNLPDGFADSLSEEDQQRLAELNTLRKRICVPFSALRTALHDATGKTAATAICTFLEQTDARGHLAETAEQLRQEATGGKREKQLADDQLRVWDLLMELLDQLAAVLGDDPLEPQRVLGLLRLAVSAAELGHLPQSLDEVTVGGAERMRPAGPRAVFVAGANQGVFPAPPGGGSVFNEEERRQLDAMGITLAQSEDEDAVDERFLAYTAMTRSRCWCRRFPAVLSEPRRQRSSACGLTK